MEWSEGRICHLWFIRYCDQHITTDHRSERVSGWAMDIRLVWVREGILQLLHPILWPTHHNWPSVREGHWVSDGHQTGLGLGGYFTTASSDIVNNSSQLTTGQRGSEGEWWTSDWFGRVFFYNCFIWSQLTNGCKRLQSVDDQWF